MEKRISDYKLAYQIIQRHAVMSLEEIKNIMQRKQPRINILFWRNRLFRKRNPSIFQESSLL